MARLLRSIVTMVVLTSPLCFGQLHNLSSYDDFYHHYSVNAGQNHLFTLPVDRDSVRMTTRCIAVKRDASDRPVEVVRLFFGNIDSRAEWAFLRISYDTLQPNRSVLERRTWHNPSGYPKKIGIGFGEDVLFSNEGELLLVTKIDSEGKRIERVNAVTRQMYIPRGKGEYTQEFRYSNNKQYFGAGFDHVGTQFAELDKYAWFRDFTIDAEGNLLEEAPLNLSKKPVAFPGGEYVRRYERNEHGSPISVSFYDRNDSPMSDSSGVATIRYTYDNYNRLIGWHAFDLEGNPRNAVVDGSIPAASMKREYRDFDGKVVSESFYDPSGNVIPTSDSEGRL